VFTLGTDADPVDIARQGLAKGKAEGFTTVGAQRLRCHARRSEARSSKPRRAAQVIVDTAGRQVIDERLMAELKGIKAAVKPDEVREKWKRPTVIASKQA
jgi:signal recognition particle subunit SRP54